jgi:hypothetical protein
VGLYVWFDLTGKTCATSRSATIINKIVVAPKRVVDGILTSKRLSMLNGLGFGNLIGDVYNFIVLMRRFTEMSRLILSSLLWMPWSLGSSYV